MNLKLLCDAAGIVCPAEHAAREITGISSDSRHVSAGEMFVCLRGLQADGHDYVRMAIEKGAACVLTDRYAQTPVCDEVILLQCADTRRALAYLWHAWYGFPARRLKIIGVTGTNGKTSVTHMIRAILEASLHKCGWIGTLGCMVAGRQIDSTSSNASASMTTPDPEVLYRVLSEMVREGVEYVVMEVSSHALALEKVAPLSFEAAVFTNLTPEHLDFHRTMENYAAAKAKLFEQSKISIFNGDSPYSAMLAAHAKGRCITCTVRDADADYAAEDISLRQDGVSYRLRSLRTRLLLSCPLPGAFSVTNSMQAAICALEMGCAPAVIKAVLGTLPPVKGRMEKVRLGLGADFTVMIDYAHTPDAMEKSLRTARGLVARGGRLTVLFGCGGDRDKTKRAVMGRIASELADEVILSSDNSRSEEPELIVEEIRAGMRDKAPVAILLDRRAAIRWAVGRAARGDLLLLCGKGHEEYEITKEGKRPFCEREIAIEAFLERKKDQTEPTT